MMQVSDAAGAKKQLHTLSWSFQQTFKTPVRTLAPFAATIVSAGSLQAAFVTIEQVVFEPEHLISLLSEYSLSHSFRKGTTVTASGSNEVAKLLRAAFADSVDFLFVPRPKSFVIYADHDEYATFYANTKSNLNRVVAALSAKSFEQVADYTRPL